MAPLRLIFSLCMTLASIWTSVDAIAVMSIDLGSEWMKIGIVSPGVPMEIVLNKESKRKTPALVAYRDSVRTFGEDAQTIGLRFPQNSYGYLLDLLAKDINHPIVKLYQKRFPQYQIVEDPERGTILFKHAEDVFYSPEELIAQLLHRAREFAEVSALQPINECVLTVPGFFNQAERKAMLQAAHLAGLKVLQLMNDYTAVALNYGIFRRKDFNETSQYVMFYDMGASKTTATVVSYQNTKTKERGIVETNPQISVLGVGYDRTLGGLEVQLRLRDFLATKFNEMKKTSNDIFKSPRSMAKLFKEAGRLKNVLSANIEHVAQVEGLIDEQDYRMQVNREQLEELCEDIFVKVGAPIEQALKTAHLTMDVISQVVLVGAGTRLPRIQDELQKVVGMELAKNLNTDEAATMGAVYKAADLSTGFKVKKIITKDAVLFPIQVVFERLDTDSASTKQVKRTLFGLMNPYPQKKIITFNRHTTDFNFNVNYADLDYLPIEEISNIGSQNLSTVSLEGVQDALSKNQADNVDSKGIKTHFSMDESGILSLAGVEFVFEKTVSADQEDQEEESPLFKLGNTISKLFTSGSGSDIPDPDAKPEDTQEEKKDGEIKNKTDEATANASETKNSTAKKEDSKPKLVVVKEPLTGTEKILSIQPMTSKQLDQAVDKLEALNEVDRARTRRETALNNLESFVIDALQKLDTPEYAKAGEAPEIEKIRTTCTQVSEWLYEEGFEADATIYEKKISELALLTRDLYSRVFEHKERPEVLKALDQMLTGATGFLTSAKNLTKNTNPDKDVFTEVEIETLSKVIKETTDWKQKTMEEQKKLKKYEPVVLTVKMVSEKMALLDREVKYLVNKLKIWRPKKIEIPVKEEPVPKDKKSDQKEQEPVIETPAAANEEDEEVEVDPTPTSEEDEHAEL